MPEIWDVSSVVYPLAVPIAQTWHELGAILLMVQQFKVKSFVEIGLDQGGLAVVMIARQNYDAGFVYYGIEIMPERIFPDLMIQKTDNIHFTDCFSPESREWIQGIINGSPGPALVFCDGGDKPKELHAFAPMLRSGDFIMAHDFRIEITQEDVDALPSGYERIMEEWLDNTRLVALKKV